MTTGEPEPAPTLDRLVSAATVGLLVCSVVIPVLGVGRVAVNGASAAQIVPAAIATAVVVPVQVWLALAASRSDASPRHRWALAALALGVVALLPVIGTTWLGAVFPLSTLVLVIVPRPYSVFVFAALVVLPIPLTHWLGEPNWATYFSLSTFMFGTSVAVPIWLIATARRLEQARLRLADEAVLRERLRIDKELFPIVGAALDTIRRHGDAADQHLETADQHLDATGQHLDAAGQHVDAERAAATEHLRTMAETARRTLTEARHLVRRYQTASLGSELATARRLLDAAGVRAEVKLPPGAQSFPLPEAERRALRFDLLALLRDDSVRVCVITVTRVRDEIGIELRGESADQGVEATVR